MNRLEVASNFVGIVDDILKLSSNFVEEVAFCIIEFFVRSSQVSFRMLVKPVEGSFVLSDFMNTLWIKEEFNHWSIFVLDSAIGVSSRGVEVIETNVPFLEFFAEIHEWQCLDSPEPLEGLGLAQLQLWLLRRRVLLFRSRSAGVGLAAAAAAAAVRVRVVAELDDFAVPLGAG